MAELGAASEDLRLLWKMFRCMTPIKLVPIELFVNCTTDCQATLVTMISSFQPHPVSQKYSKSFLKKLIELREADDSDVEETLYDLYISLLNSPCQDGGSVYKTYYIASGIDCHTITIKESAQIISEGTTALVTWKASLVCCEWMLSNKELFSGRSVVELGSGLGLVGLCAIKALAIKSFLFTDKRAMELKSLMANLEINHCNFKSPFEDSSEDRQHIDDVQLDSCPCVNLELLDWTCYDQDKIGKQGVDIILASDVCYDSAIIPSLVGCVGNLLRAGPRRVAYITSTIRNPDTYNCFLEALENNRLQWEPQTPGKQIFFYEDDTEVEVLKILPR